MKKQITTEAIVFSSREFFAKELLREYGITVTRERA